MLTCIHCSEKCQCSKAYLRREALEQWSALVSDMVRYMPTVDDYPATMDDLKTQIGTLMTELGYDFKNEERQTLIEAAAAKCQLARDEWLSEQSSA